MNSYFINYDEFSILDKINTIYGKIVKLANNSWRQPSCRGGHYSFSLIAPLTLDPYLFFFFFSTYNMWKHMRYPNLISCQPVLSPWLAADEVRVFHVLSHVWWKKEKKKRHYSFPLIAPLTLDPYLVILSVKQGSIKYHFLMSLVWLIWSLSQLTNTLPTRPMGMQSILYRIRYKINIKKVVA